jgi:CheY-like chemotaxis protein
MLAQSSNRGFKDLSHQKILLIDRCQATREVRVNVLQSHGVEVHAIEDFSAARVRWQPGTYDYVLLDIRKFPAEEALEWCGQIKDRSPRQRIAFLVGAPAYLSLTWPGEVIAASASSGQWGETVKRFLAAA